jgi:eukaryotic-like serine/threonine-protein kinase
MSDPTVTTDDNRLPGTNADTPTRRDTFAPGQHVATGAVGQLATETRTLLRQRLRAASLVIVIGFGLFFARSLILHRHHIESLAVFFQGLMLAMLLLEFGILSRRRTATLRELRVIELALFVSVVVFLMASQYVLMRRAVRFDDVVLLRSAVKSSVLWVLAIIFTYAIFIPNTWRRAAALVVPMALAPVLVPWLLGLIHPEFYEVAVRAADFEQVSEHALFLLLGAFTAIFGTHTINSLRTAAYEARLLNQYRLGRRLGGGGMGEVYLALHQLLKRPCAIKLIRPDLAANPRVFARFEREVRATAQLSHWNTIEIFDYGRNDDGAFYYVMEYLPGLSLAELVERFGPMHPARAIYLLRQACDALTEAHDSGLIHRDIKPANLMAAHRGGQYDVAKLLDFGLVKTLSSDRSIHITKEGTIAGSPLYMAPEQIMNTHPPDRRTDIYGLGAVAYYMLTGRPPFTGDAAMAVMVAHARDPVTPPSQLRSEIPADLESIVLRCLAKNPDDRYPDTATLAAALARSIDAVNWSPSIAAEWWRTHFSLNADPAASPADAMDEPSQSGDERDQSNEALAAAAAARRIR